MFSNLIINLVFYVTSFADYFIKFFLFTKQHLNHNQNLEKQEK